MNELRNLQAQSEYHVSQSDHRLIAFTLKVFTLLISDEFHIRDFVSSSYLVKVKNLSR